MRHLRVAIVDDEELARKLMREYLSGCEDIAIVRVEQLYPFPEKELASVLARYGRKQEVCWVQEEPN